MKCTKRLLLAAILAFVAVQAFAANSVLPPPLLAKIEAKYKEAKTLSAHFNQVNKNAATGTSLTSHGLLFVKIPHKVRWDTQEPQANLLVGNGKKFWLYTPPFDPTDPTEHGQVMEKDANQIQSEFASALLTGAFSGSISKITSTDSEHYVLIPLKGTAGSVKEADIAIDSKLLLITDVTLKHQGGNTSVIHLSEIALGKPLEDGLFVFKIPPNTDRI